MPARCRCEKKPITRYWKDGAHVPRRIHYSCKSHSSAHQCIFFPPNSCVSIEAAVSFHLFSPFPQTCRLCRSEDGRVYEAAGRHRSGVLRLSADWDHRSSQSGSKSIDKKKDTHIRGGVSVAKFAKTLAKIFKMSTKTIGGQLRCVLESLCSLN